MSGALLKKLAVAAALLLVVWAVYLYRQVPHSPAPFAKASARVEEIRIEQGPKSVDLKKQIGAWKVLGDAGAIFPADENVVKTLISDLKEVQVEDEISDRADRAGEYEVNPASGTRVRFCDAKGRALAEGLFGKQAPDGNHIYFRYPDKPNVYLARGLFRGELGKPESNAWRSRQLIDIPETKMQGIVIESKGAKTDLVLVSTDVWTLNGQPGQAGPINALVGTLAHLRADDFIDPVVSSGLSYEGLAYAHLQVKGAESSVDLRIGALDLKTRRHPASVGKDAGLVWLSESIVKSLLQKPVDSKNK